MIFPDFDPCAKHVSIFIGGLSNETAVVNNPAEKDANGNPIKVVLQKTLELQYDISAILRSVAARRLTLSAAAG